MMIFHDGLTQSPFYISNLLTLLLLNSKPTAYILFKQGTSDYSLRYYPYSLPLVNFLTF